MFQMAVTESTCTYLIHNDQWLMLYRNAKNNDINHGKWLGIGGKRESCETYEECAVREIYEETGLKALKLEYQGEIFFYEEKVQSEYIRIYTCYEFSGETGKCDEGDLSWIPEEKLMDLSLWEGDRIFLARMIERQDLPFSLAFYYDKDQKLVHAQDL